MSGNLVSYITVYISIYLMSISFRRCYAVAEFSAFTSVLLSSSLRDHLFVVLGLFLTSFSSRNVCLKSAISHWEF